jgi:hypothetical protein
MFNKEYVKAQKDHMHFTDLCYKCGLHREHRDIIPVWVSRLSGLVPKSYLEPDYICIYCDEKHTKEVEALNE